MLLSKGQSVRSASSTNGHLWRRITNLPWEEVHALVNDKLPQVLQETLRAEMALMEEPWRLPLLDNDAHIIRERNDDLLPEKTLGLRHAEELLRPYLQGRDDSEGRIINTLMLQVKHSSASEAFEFLARSMPTDQRATFLEWLATHRAAKRRRQFGP